MLGGSLTRYHTPSLKGKGFKRDVLQWATPALMQSIGTGLDAYSKGATPGQALDGSTAQLKRQLKRKIPGLITGPVKRKLVETYKTKRKRFRDIFHV